MIAPKPKMTKKTKLIALILTIIIIFTLLVILSLTTMSHCMKINVPNRIIVYYNDETANKVYENDTEQFNNIYSSVIKSYKQSTIASIINGKLFKDVKIIYGENSVVNFDGVKISFVYDTPQVVKYKDKLYSYNNENYWYQTLIFDIPLSDNYAYNSIAIIPPFSSNEYVSPFKYNLSYRAYSNFNKTYKIVTKLFE